MRYFRRILCTLLILTLTACPLAGAVQLSDIRDFDASGFTDVPDDWSRPYIAKCYELGLMSGHGNGIFAPGGAVSVAEGIAVTARIHNLWNGGDGNIPAGKPWYTGAVEYARSNNLLRDGEFTGYNAPATRAQLAGLLARALPPEEYAAINQISKLPDVGSATPYSESIFTLYNAGILSGNDAYGTFQPEEPVTRAALAAILCRLVQPDTRVALTLQEPPAGPAMAYTSDKLLWVGNVPLAGLVTIGGEYYFPLELLNSSAVYGFLPLEYSNFGSEHMLHVRDRFFADSVAMITPTIAVPAGKPIGQAQVDTKPLCIENTSIYNEVRTLNGRYPMVRLAALADFLDYQDDGTGVKLCADKAAGLSVAWETDLAGQAAAARIKDSPRATAQAFHDYLVNTLTHSDGIDSAYFQQNDPSRHAREQELQSKYRYSNNYHLAWGYGVCQNYAELLQAMCVQSGIPCQIVSGEPDHAWNRVYINGVWSYVDVTWDDPIGTPTLRQDYFLAGPDVMVKDHYWKDADYPMPAEYDPAWEKLDPNNITSADMYRKCLVAQVMQGKSSFSLRTTVPGAYGGSACVYAYPVSWWSMCYGYNASTNTYDYKFEMW